MAATPTGCYKCGRPGHWSRDCPSAPSSSSFPDAPPPPSKHPVSDGKTLPSGASKGAKPAKSAPALPRKRPKLTPDLLLSNDGLGYVLERFPRMVRIQGSGHEVEDLGSLLEAYMHWHSRILPYFSFDQFVEKLEKVGATKRVRVCIHELRQKVHAGEEPKPGDITDSNGLAKDVNSDDHDFVLNEASQLDLLTEEIEDMQHENAIPTDVHEDVFEEFYKQATEEAQGPPSAVSRDVEYPVEPIPCHATIETVCVTEKESHPTPLKDITEEQRARMEANRLKALERGKGRVTL